MRHDQIIKKAILSEQAYGAFEKGVYTLEVALKSTKTEIKAALKSIFNVDAIKINTSVLRGDIVRRARSKKSGAVMVKLPNTKKAMVRLKQGQALPAPVWSAQGTESTAVSTEVQG
jgi:large subunit ribosomal protein L23